MTSKSTLNAKTNIEPKRRTHRITKIELYDYLAQKKLGR